MHSRDRLAASSARLILFGSEGGFSRAVLEQLLAKGPTVTAVVMVEQSNGDTHFPVGIKHDLAPDSLEGMATKNRIEILKTPTLVADAFIQQLLNRPCDIFLVACFAQIIPARIWQDMSPPCWNLHPSLLPKYRGPNPLYWQIRNHETQTGLTLHEVTGHVDGGDIVARIALALPTRHDKNSLDEWVSVNGMRLFHSALSQYLRGEIKPEPQDETTSSYYPAPGRNTKPR